MHRRSRRTAQFLERVMRFINLLCFAVLVVSASASAQPDASLCASNERVVFSCSVTYKIASLCARLDEQKQVKALWYRFGSWGKKPELVFPTRGDDFRNQFTAVFGGGAKGSYSAISFHRGAHSYTLYSSHAAFETDERSNGAGIRIKKNGAEVEDLWCDDDRIFDEIQVNLYHLGLRKTSRDAL
jgi:hypothetical protein